MHRVGWPHLFIETSVNAIPDSQPFLVALDVDIAGILAHRLVEQVIDELHDRRLAGYLGWFMTRVILGLVFLLVFSPAGLIMRLLGRDPLKLRFDRRAASYWESRAEQDRSPERMERMF